MQKCIEIFQRYAHNPVRADEARQIVVRAVSPTAATNAFGDPVAVCPVNGPDCELCGPGHEFPCSAHWTDEMARAELASWRSRYTPEKIEDWLAFNAGRPGAMVPA